MHKQRGAGVDYQLMWGFVATIAPMFRNSFKVKKSQLESWLVVLFTALILCFALMVDGVDGVPSCILSFVKHSAIDRHVCAVTPCRYVER